MLGHQLGDEAIKLMLAKDKNGHLNFGEGAEEKVLHL